MKRIKELFAGRFTLIKMIVLYLQFILTKPDRRLEHFKGMYRGKRCFIIGLGPSLTIQDLDKLNANKEFCISVNRIYETFSQTKWRPDFYFISDVTASTPETKDAIDKMIQEDKTNVFYAKYSFKEMRNEAIPCRMFDVYTPLHNTKSRFLAARDKRTKFSSNAGSYIYDSMSCVISAVQLAYYMGFNKVYLLGCDCGSNKGKEYGECLKKRDKLYYDDAGVRMLIDDYAALNKDIEKKELDFKIYNATRGGNLEEFERVDFDQLF